MIIRAKRDPFYQMIDNGDGTAYPCGEDGSIMPPEDWQALKERIDQFYADIAPEDIQDHNDQVRIEYLKEMATDFYQKRPVPLRIRKQVFERDGHRCKHCGSVRNLSVDHIYPESKGGTMDLSNLQTLCGSCNSRKGTQVETE